MELANQPTPAIIPRSSILSRKEPIPMCGILGIVGREVLPPVIERMAGSMRHRGPDAGGILRFKNGALAHRRLSILDVSAAANQPLVDPDQQAAVVFNGEIYNYHE